jgi:antitoxin VapB
MMPFETVKIQKKSGSQTIRIPESLRIEDDKVYLKRVGNSIYVIPFHDPWESLIQSTELFTDDYLDQRNQPKVQERDFFE